jgi:flagellar basal-body rod modification protein FlgD
MAINPIDQSVFEQLGLSRKEEPKAKDSLGQNEFLKLMTTQLNNQDPMKPMEGGEFFSQIAQFSSVAGIQELQSTFTKVADAMFSGQALQASSLVGRNVMVESNTGQLRKDSLLEGAVELPSSPDDLVINVYNSTGELINNIEMGPQQRGVVDFSWDGKVKDGSYAASGEYILKAEARYGREYYSQQTWIKERIDSVTLGDGLQGISLNMSDNSSVTLGQVKKIL